MNKFNRRTFLKATAAASAVAAVPVYLNFSEHKKVASEAPLKKVWTQCNGCSSMCTKAVYSKNNRLWKVEGHPLHLKAGGRLCARGHGVAIDVYNPSRVDQPYKRVGDSFEPISWEQANAEIGEKLTNIVDQHSGDSVLWVEHGPRGKFYADIFLDLIGSPNYCTHYSTCFTSKTNVWPKMVGSSLAADHENADYLLFAGRNFAGGIIPNGMSKIHKALERGAKLVVVDPKYNEMAKLADEWIPIRPGTDLAFFLGIAHTLISENLYDYRFIGRHVHGFYEFWEANKTADADWAAEVTGIPAETIRRIAREMAAKAPKAILEPGWHGLHAHYANSTQTAQMNVIVNALLGNFYKIGGLYPAQNVPFGSVDRKIPRFKRRGDRADGAGVAGKYPTVEPGRGIAQLTPKLIEDGTIKAVFIYHYNPLRTAPNPEEQKKIKNAELVVVIPTDWNETAVYTADYVLPEHYYLERTEAPRNVNGHVAHIYPQIAIRQTALEPIHNTRHLKDIIDGIATSMGYEGYFDFTLDEEVEAALTTIEDVSRERLYEEGVIEFTSHFVEGIPSEHNTSTGKVNFSVPEYAEHGFSGFPTWVPPATWPKAENEFRLIHGKQPWHSHSVTSNNPYLLEMTKKYNGEWMWMNAIRAEKLGIKNGDVVTIHSSVSTKQAKVKVTELLHPDCVWVANSYGNYSPRQKNGYGIGVNFNDFLEVMVEPMAGGTNCQEIIVSITKGVS
ncbi:respiratory selenite reductase catalytic subunit SrrA [Desulfuribacillus alkaliarsenatis]|uniref:Dehydrogenase n=1 Tax=Desulfuribacillus alkaliarsenatis TaxID=766136 RepID=A0A1E5G1N5_9FIRM|nr:respiratory selenite reductase catalytic subunit SrrA [Desulfuribacillus alkaliarsenatis]OEF96746.1 dehydrogenase [Desulfuribacillus alkaliarsenatis]